MNTVPFPSLAPPSAYFPMVPPDPPPSSAFWQTTTVIDRLKELRDTINLAKAMQKELEMFSVLKDVNRPIEYVDNGSTETSVSKFSELLKDRGISLTSQESLSVEATNSLILKLRAHLEPFRVITDERSPWEEKSAAVRLCNKMQKSKRNKLWRKRKRKRLAETHARERERFDHADQEADEWRAREIAKDIAKRKVEKMKEIAKLKAKEERKRLESELELVLIVEKLQQLRSIRIQKLKKQGHFLPDEDDKFLERVRAAVEEEERQAMAAADTDAAKDAIATAEESRKINQGQWPDSKDLSSEYGQNGKSQDQMTENENRGGSSAAANEKSQKRVEDRGFDGAYDSVASLPIEFYHYYHGSNTDMGTLIEVRRTWDAYIRLGGSRIPGHFVQPPPPADEIWASYMVGHK
ncbi:U11/U12 small nuclear ribonucleoprotein 59 kDa protein isoform X2 [Malania oleifera]|nr:U11/U12 small nuclear ribonucleoprotein 59 kDa protein isoform X2 [Malania oleifera]XP_057980310.1 U11/U12 small nuclear ribonucleoprotein 59 kDa protein isoform X2 [Malania oleifera]XP_057980311.1 U11/U12 small nuclear ribonucleoprotein 59 kDa protein isoform X2 [Malania oleifera]XP_057980312.1 U11/U12 small nuclear ribonucleoprotein 59 kDa protein isoform X2 [Malania oleifera]XP_057980313.1 U11/U12 small nuclear ribonucleoprotein 59 kDa protein isoform X2 [Malania oleifera]XP_057980314.1 